MLKFTIGNTKKNLSSKLAKKTEEIHVTMAI